MKSFNQVVSPREIIIFAVVLIAVFLSVVPLATARNVNRVSVSSTGVQADDASDDVSLNSNGRYVAFLSEATNLVSGDTNNVMDVFVHDRVTGVTERVSVSSTEVEANGDSDDVSISANGRYVAFRSNATNLVSGDTNGVTDVFLRDRTRGLTARMSVSSAGVEGNGTAHHIAISATSSVVVFSSDATNLVGNDTNGVRDIFTRDFSTGVTERVSISSADAESNGDSEEPVVSEDGRYVVFQSSATSLVPSDTNGVIDIFIRDRQGGTTERISIASNNAESNGESTEPSMSANGRYVAFSSTATNLGTGDTNGVNDIFVRDRTRGLTARVSITTTGVQGNDRSQDSQVSVDGRYVAFQSMATNLTSGDTNGAGDIFFRDITNSTTERVNLNTADAEASSASDNFTISSDARFVGFSSDATNFVAGDTNGVADVFVVDRLNSDGDVILDEIDTDPTNTSSSFSDIEPGATTGTTGTITSAGDQTYMTIKNSTVANEGIVIITGADLGSNPAVIDTCPTRTAVRTNVYTDSEVTITCGSFMVKLDKGNADIEFTANGQTATADLNPGNALFYDDITNELRTPTENTEVVVVVIGGINTPLSPGSAVLPPPPSNEDDDDEDGDDEDRDEGKKDEDDRDGDESDRDDEDRGDEDRDDNVRKNKDDDDRDAEIPKNRRGRRDN